MVLDSVAGRGCACVGRGGVLCLEAAEDCEVPVGADGGEVILIVGFDLNGRGYIRGKGIFNLISWMIYMCTYISSRGET